MRIAITGGTGFVGGAVADDLVRAGHQVVLVARGHDERISRFREAANVQTVEASVTDEDALAIAFDGCNVVLHLAGINREIGSQTYEAVHVQGTHNVVAAAKRCGVDRIALLSYVRARPECGSGYLESKWESEEIVRGSGLGYLVLKAGMIYGRGDHMLDHLSKSIGTFHIVTKVGLRDRTIAPVAVDDVVEIIRAFVLDGELRDVTVDVVGPERFPMGDAIRRVARAMGTWVWVPPMPVVFLRLIGWLSERLMRVPLVARAQVRLLVEGPEPLGASQPLPSALAPSRRLDNDAIIRGLPERRRYSMKDLRWAGSR